MIALGFFLYTSATEAIWASLYGSGIALGMSFMLQADVRKAARFSVAQPGKSMRVLFLGAAIRFLAVIAAFVLGLQFLGLLPVELLVGFGLTQLCYVFIGHAQKPLRD